MRTSPFAYFVEAYGKALVFGALAVALAGLAFAFSLPVSLFPQTDFPRVVILVDNGVTPIDQQALTVTRRLEEAARRVPGVTDIRSVTSRGATEISVLFRWDVNIVDSLQLIQGEIAQIAPTLPPESRYYINRLTFSVFPTIGFSLTSPGRSLAELWELAYWDLAPRLYRIPGVMEARIVGGRESEFHVLVDPERLNRYGLSLTSVSNAIRDANIISSGGMVQENYHLYLTTVTGLMHNPAQIAQTVVAVLNGTPVRIADLAEVVKGERPIYNIVTADGHPAVLINVLQQPDGNALQIAQAVNAELALIKQTLPADINLATFYDQSILVRDSILGVRDAILLGLVLSVAVLLVFLKDWRTTLVASLVIPLSLLIAVVLMELLQMSFNLMTLGGMAACVGIVIDDAIVMVENITVHMSMGQTRAEAARSAITELTPALIGSTLTPIMVFAPLIFLGGITAVFFRSLAATMVTALLASLFLALFFTPVLAAAFLRTRSGPRAKTIEEAEQAGEGGIMRAVAESYDYLLKGTLDRSRAALGVLALIVAGSTAIYFQLGSGFLPEVDEGAFVLDYVMPPGTSLNETDRVLQHIELILRDTPEVESYSRRTGARLALAIAEPNTGDFLVKLEGFPRRPLAEVTDDIRQRVVSSEPAIEVEFPHILEDLIGDLAWSPEPIEIKVFHPDPAAALALGQRIEEWLPSVPGTVDVFNQNVVVGPAIDFRVDPAKAALAGFTAQDVADLQAGMLDGIRASETIVNNRIYGIRVRYPESSRSRIADIESLLVTSPTGNSVPLSSIADVNIQEGQREIHRDNLREAVVVTSQLSGRDLGSTMAEIQRRLPQEIELPAGTDIEYGGIYKIQSEAFRSLTQVLVGSILLIFIVLVFEFQAFAQPLAILAATVLCGSGSLAALWLTGSTLNICSFMGMIMVVGIVHKNGILLLDAEQSFRRDGFSLREAIEHAGRRRLRPIMMTALATIFGMAPLAFGVGSGAQILQPLAIAVIGGVSVSLVLSLIATPVIYYHLSRVGGFFR
ncbi:MAG: efflux RND transporter permease subunit [Acidobacteria bacterium]|nr:efflux RND transporter permease subunit [Acidobacteriota bacterium]MDA1236741.1 efflux RND transporter permease subunit [Acidobacteriota bacterium]